MRFGKAADSFLMPFVSKWIADKDDRAARVRMLQAILEAVATENQLDSSQWNEKKSWVPAQEVGCQGAQCTLEPAYVGAHKTAALVHCLTYDLHITDDM